MEHHENFLSLWDLVKLKYGTYIYHRIANVMRIKNIPYVGGLRQTGPPQEVSKNGTARKFSKSLGLSQIAIGTQTYGYVI